MSSVTFNVQSVNLEACGAAWGSPAKPRRACRTDFFGTVAVYNTADRPHPLWSCELLSLFTGPFESTARLRRVFRGDWDDMFGQRQNSNLGRKVGFSVQFEKVVVR